MSLKVVKKYVIYYPPDLRYPRIQLVQFDFFTEDKGFRRMEIDEIESLDPMCSVQLAYLKVWRIE